MRSVVLAVVRACCFLSRSSVDTLECNVRGAREMSDVRMPACRWVADFDCFGEPVRLHRRAGVLCILRDACMLVAFVGLDSSLSLPP